LSTWGDKNKSGGGGFLNNVDAKIIGYKFTNDFPGENAKQDEETKLYMILTVREDGADEDSETTLNGGGGEFFEISEDGQTLTSVDADRAPKLWSEGGIYKFIDSLVDAEPLIGERLGDVEETKAQNFAAIIGTRVRLKQVAVIKDGKPLMRKVKKGKFAGKEFPVTNLAVEKVLELPAVAGAKAAAPKTGKKNTNGSGKPAAAAAAAAVDTSAADNFVTSLLAAAKGNTVKLADINLPITRLAVKLQTTDEDREAIRALLTDAAYISDAVVREIVTYNEKTGVIGLPA